MGNLLGSCGLGASIDNQRPFLRAYGSNAQLMDKLKDVGLEQKHLHALHQIFSAMDRGAYSLTPPLATGGGR